MFVLSQLRKFYQERSRFEAVWNTKQAKVCTRTVLFGVGPHETYGAKTAYMRIYQGYANAFESAGYDFLFCDIRDVEKYAETIDNPILFLNGSDYQYLNDHQSLRLRKFKKVVWLNPWFRDSDHFFRAHGLDKKIWNWSALHRRRIVESDPIIGITATTPKGLCFFQQWADNGIAVESMPLACDTSRYQQQTEKNTQFADVKYAFVGGYWDTKGKELDRYLRPLEDQLVIYGRNRWPYRSYKGVLDDSAEQQLYRQAMVCPVINEPSVRILHGQINERVFKVMGSGGLALVDAVPAFRELFAANELIVPKNHAQFLEYAHVLLHDPTMRDAYREAGTKAVLQRHTYKNRVEALLVHLAKRN